MKLLNVSPFKVGSRYKSVCSDFWFEVISVTPCENNYWEMEYRCRTRDGIKQEKGKIGHYLANDYVEVPKDETAQ